MTSTAPSAKGLLAIDGASPTVREPVPVMAPGGMRMGEEEEAALISCIRGRRLFRYYGGKPGPSLVAAFETEWAARTRVAHCLGLSSGTAALMSAMAALDIGEGDEVIVPGFAWVSNITAIVGVGAVPVIAEIDESLGLDIRDVEAKITPYTRALCAVHMNGAPAQMREIMACAQRHGLKVIEDVSQAAGGTFDGQPLGSIGHLGAFSFQWNKPITSGEGGALTTNDYALFERACMYHDVLGGIRTNTPLERILPGFNLRMGELQGALLQVQNGRLDQIILDCRTNRAIIAAATSAVFARKGVTTRRENDPHGDIGVAWIFLLPSAERLAIVAAALRMEGVPVRAFLTPGNPDAHVYAAWLPLFHKNTWSKSGRPWTGHPRAIEYDAGMCPQTLGVLGRALCVDISPDLTDDHLEQIADAVNKVLEVAL